MRRRRRFIGLSLAVLACAAPLAACSSTDSTPPLSNDEAVASLMAQGYSEEGAQCMITEVQKQNIDIYEFLVKAKVTDRELDVMSTVGAYCARQFGLGGTTLPPQLP